MNVLSAPLTEKLCPPALGYQLRPGVQGLNLAAIGAETDRRGFVPVSEQMEVLDKAGKPVSNVYCIGDANGEPSASLIVTLPCRCKQAANGDSRVHWNPRDPLTLSVQSCGN